LKAYIGNAELLCEACGDKAQREVGERALREWAAAIPIPEVDLLAASVSDYMRKYPKTLAKALGFDPENESEYDSGDYPKGPIDSGGGEADSPQHCGHCGVFLDNPLTGDGDEYVAQAFFDHLVFGDGNRVILREWFAAYRDGIPEAVLAEIVLAKLDTLFAEAPEDSEAANG